MANKTFSVRILSEEEFKIIEEINIFTDGGSRGNPGPAGIGVYITDKNGKEVASIGKHIGNATNNVAEYKAVLEALSWILANKEILGNNPKINFFLDSKLVYSQIAGLFKVKNSLLRTILYEIREKEAQAKSQIFYSHIPREKNTKADEMVNKALDQVKLG